MQTGFAQGSGVVGHCKANHISLSCSSSHFFIAQRCSINKMLSFLDPLLSRNNGEKASHPATYQLLASFDLFPFGPL